jgi:hypothetical protein
LSTWFIIIPRKFAKFYTLGSLLMITRLLGKTLFFFLSFGCASKIRFQFVLLDGTSQTTCQHVPSFSFCGQHCLCCRNAWNSVLRSGSKQHINFSGCPRIEYFLFFYFICLQGKGTIATLFMLLIQLGAAIWYVFFFSFVADNELKKKKIYAASYIPFGQRMIRSTLGTCFV